MIPPDRQPTRQETLASIEREQPPEAFVRASERRNGHLGSVSAQAGTIGREFVLADLGPMLRGAARIVGRYWWFGLFCASVIGALTFHFATEHRAVHTAEATLVARSALDQALRRGEGTVDDAERRENALRNHYAVMTSREFRSRVAASLSEEEALRLQLPYLQPGESPSGERLRSVLAGTISIERERGRELFIVRATHRSGEAALALVNHFVNTYLEGVRDGLRAADREAQAALQSQADDLAASIDKLEGGRREFRLQYNDITGGGGELVLADRIKNLNEALSEVRVARAAADVELRRAEADMERSPTPFDNPILAEYSNNQELRAEIERRRAERAVLAAHYGPKHPKMIEADGIVAGLDATLQSNFKVALEGVRSKVDLAVASERQLQQELAGVLAQADEIERLAGELATLDGEIAARRDAHRELLGKVARAGISAGLPADVMRVVDEAYLRQPLLETRTFIVLVGTIAAGLAFVGGPLLIHACNRRVSSNTDVERVLGVELLGALPRLSWMLNRNRPHIVRRNRRRLPVASFLSIASEFALRASANGPRRIVVSSTLPAEGKSIVASNLAAAFTRLGYRTLLVDADFRRPAQHRFNQLGNDSGILAWIDRGCPEFSALSEAGRELGLHGLSDGTWFLPAGGFDPEPARHWIRPETATLFDRCRDEFDVTIIDTPPAGLFADAFFVARLADATAFVVREGVASTAQVRKVIAGFARTPAPVTGLIFNELARSMIHPLFRYRTASLKYQRLYGPRRGTVPAVARRRPVRSAAAGS